MKEPAKNGGKAHGAETVGNGLQNGIFLSPKQEAAALALAAGSTLDEAAQKSGAGVTTIKRWLHEQPNLRRRVNELRSELTSRALGRLVDGMVSAADTLGFLCRKGKSEMVRLSAARAIIELGSRLRENVELEERIAVLEQGRQQQRKIA